ncbi:hypothetical protein EV659_101301 [Rhodothalassium salexigens DSM 2132]|uniref:Uncharacterized protein n=1 Tax=Rhodothalassium salexigens DSM 2132 TaxID=1188247 RepID=A0A4R2PRN6_RHOSA|nr:hypothetical protein [Rhodothalassium salexigens DSM 2132]TCP38397.1 hypothetical protein EV659_101301 [Rhodothalassium salexigens DSM 2132]
MAQDGREGAARRGCGRRPWGLFDPLGGCGPPPPPPRRSVAADRQGGHGVGGMWQCAILPLQTALLRCNIKTASSRGDPPQRMNWPGLVPGLFLSGRQPPGFVLASAAGPGPQAKRQPCPVSGRPVCSAPRRAAPFSGSVSAADRWFGQVSRGAKSARRRAAHTDDPGQYDTCRPRRPSPKRSGRIAARSTGPGMILRLANFAPHNQAKKWRQRGCNRLRAHKHHPNRQRSGPGVPSKPRAALCGWGRGNARPGSALAGRDGAGFCA